MLWPFVTVMLLHYYQCFDADAMLVLTAKASAIADKR